MSAGGRVDAGAAGGEPTWSAVAPMPAARCSHAAAAALDGRIYVMGDECGGNTDTAAYDPATDSWSAVAPLHTFRRMAAAATGTDGRVYTLGGVDQSPGGFGYLASVEAYDPAGDTWSDVAPMPRPRSMLAATTGSDGRIYALGGCCDPTTNFSMDSAEAYDPATGTWATLAPLPTPRFGLAAATGPDGRIYAIGGRRDLTNTNCCPVATVEAYDPATGTWSTVAPLPRPTEVLAAATGRDGRIYAFGGLTFTSPGGESTILDQALAYDPATDTWSDVPSMSTLRAGPAAVLGSDGRIYVIGGHNRLDDRLNPLRSVEALTTPGPVDRADVSVQLQAPARAATGSLVTVTVTVTNHGPAPASRPSVALRVPAGLRVSSVTPGHERRGRIFRWATPTLAPGEALTLTVMGRVTARPGARLTFAASARSRTDDPAPGDNSAVATVQVTRRH